MNLTIDTKSPLPVYQQVIQAIKLDILSGGLRDGDLLPSIRDLAKLLKLNPNTVAKAYYALADGGFLREPQRQRQPGQGAARPPGLAAPGHAGKRIPQFPGEGRLARLFPGRHQATYREDKK